MSCFRAAAPEAAALAAAAAASVCARTAVAPRFASVSCPAHQTTSLASYTSAFLAR